MAAAVVDQYGELVNSILRDGPRVYRSPSELPLKLTAMLCSAALACDKDSGEESAARHRLFVLLVGLTVFHASRGKFKLIFPILQ